MTLVSKFPHRDHTGSPDFRTGQREILRQLHRAVRSDQVEFVLFEAPTGFGKTAVAGTIAHHHGPSYYLTQQKIHQDQLVDEFPVAASIKGRDNYECGDPENGCAASIPGSTCHRKPTTDPIGSYAAESDDRGTLYWRPGTNRCPYYDHKTDALESPIACVNYPYFLNETYWSGDFGGRQIMILDEAHNLESALRQFLSFSVDREVVDETGLRWPTWEQDLSQWDDWIVHDLESAISGRVDALEDEVQNQWTSDDPAGEVLKDLDKMQELLVDIHRFDQEWDDEYFEGLDWVMEKSEDQIEIYPVTIAPFADRLLYQYADTVILISATILDMDLLRRQLGLQSRDVYEIQITQSPFPTDHREITWYDAPSVNHGNWESVFPKIAELVDGVCHQYPDEKGLIHTVSYENGEVLRGIVSQKTRDRMIFHRNRDRDQAIEEFESSDYPQILCSPGLYEGIDLKYDLSRFQVIPKVPFPSLGSRVVEVKQDRDPQWYDWLTTVRLVQAVGRSVRARDDWADTHILDGSFGDFYRRARDLFPDYINGKTALSIEHGDVEQLVRV